MPKGPLGVPRLTDLGPLVSHHRDSPSNCDVEFAYGGQSKGEAARDVLTAYQIAHSRAGEELPQEPVGTFLVGSTVRGDFGCREKWKINQEWEFLGEEARRERPQFFDMMDSIISQSSDSMEFLSTVNRRKDKFPVSSQRAMDLAFEMAVSDMDIFSVYETDSRKVQDLQFRPEYSSVIDSINTEIADNINVNMSASYGIRGQDFLDRVADDKPVAESPEEYKELIQRYY